LIVFDLRLWYVIRKIQDRGFAPFGILECWNNGIMVLGKRDVGLMAKFVLTIKLIMDNILFKNQHSNIP
jgi:hypothetical protein